MNVRALFFFFFFEISGSSLFFELYFIGYAYSCAKFPSFVPPTQHPPPPQAIPSLLSVSLGPAE